jgi:outer membrane protein
MFFDREWTQMNADVKARPRSAGLGVVLFLLLGLLCASASPPESLTVGENEDHSLPVEGNGSDSFAELSELTASPSAPLLRLSLRGALVGALEQNHDLAVRRLDPVRAGTAVDRNQARFDPTVRGSLSSSDRLGKQILQAGTLGDNVTNRSDGGVSLTRRSRSGTQATVGLDVTRNRSARAANLFSTRLGLEVTRPLRRDAGVAANMVAVDQARLDVRMSAAQLAGYVLAFTANVERRYWGLFLARKELEIVRESRLLAVSQLEETRKRIELGSIPESELAAAEAELALREEAVINAHSQLAVAHIALLRLINPGAERFWEYQIELLDFPAEVEGLADEPDLYLESALRLRPELLQARLALARNDLDLVRTRNGLLPRLDFFTTLGKSGFAQSLTDTATEFGQRAYDLQAGLRYELAVNRREARAEHRDAQYSRIQREKALENLTQLVQEDVLAAFLEARRANEQIKATGKTVAKQMEKLRVESIKFNVGRTTAFQVAQAQRDAAAALISELKARVAFINAMTDLYRLDGSLCQRHGIELPCAETPAGGTGGGNGGAGPLHVWFEPLSPIPVVSSMPIVVPAAGPENDPAVAAPPARH